MNQGQTVFGLDLAHGLGSTERGDVAGGGCHVGTSVERPSPRSTGGRLVPVDLVSCAGIVEGDVAAEAMSVGQLMPSWR